MKPRTLLVLAVVTTASACRDAAGPTRGTAATIDRAVAVPVALGMNRTAPQVLGPPGEAPAGMPDMARMPRVMDHASLAAGDGASLVWQNVQTGERSLSLMSGTTWSGQYASLPTVAAAWQIAAIADFNADGVSDLVWQNTQTGERSIWLMNGTNWGGQYALLPTVSTSWSIAGVSGFTPPTMHPAGNVVATVSFSTRVYGAAISSAGVVLVAQPDVGSVRRLDLATATAGAAIAVGSTPSHVAFAPNGATAYVANQGSHDVSVVDVATSRTTATIPLESDAWNVIVSADGTRLYATTDSGRLYVIDTSNNTILASVSLSVGDALRGLALSPDDAQLYVTVPDAGTLQIVDRRTLALTRTISLGGRPRVVAFTRTGNAAVVTNEYAGAVTIVR